MTPTDTQAEIEELAQVALSDNTSTGMKAKARLDGRYGFSSPARASAYAKAIRHVEALLFWMPSLARMTEIVGLTKETAPKFAQAIGDAYVFLEEVEFAAHKEEHDG